MEYPEQAIKALTASLDGDEEAYKFLTISKWKELAALTDVLISGNDTAVQYLIANKTKYQTIVNFIAALQKEDKAFELLMASDKKWAAVVDAINGDDGAYKWLENNQFSIYAELADVLIDQASNGSSHISSFGGGSSGGSSSGGFGGFGGGSFGGAGSSGKW